MRCSRLPCFTLARACPILQSPTCDLQVMLLDDCRALPHLVQCSVDATPQSSQPHQEWMLTQAPSKPQQIASARTGTYYTMVHTSTFQMTTTLLSSRWPLWEGSDRHFEIFRYLSTLLNSRKRLYRCTDQRYYKLRNRVSF